MSSKIYMPALSPTMTEGILSKWLVKVGDKIKAGDILAEIETDKATMEVEAVDEGTITKLLIEEGSANVPVNAIIAILDGDEKDILELDKNENKNENKFVTKNEKNKDKKFEDIKSENNNINIVNENKILLRGDQNERIIASPYVKSFASNNDINLKMYSGSGPNGRIIKRDLNKQKSELNIDSKINGDLKLPSSMRKIIAERTSLTKQTVPHFYLTIESNVDKLLAMRKKINEKNDFKISINDILVKALAYAQKKNPKTNTSWIDGKILEHKTVDVSIAVALEEGLVTPIIKNTDKKGLKEISIEIKSLADKAKKGKLSPEEYNGGTISISNLGMFGITEFSAIINPPQSSILAVGAIKSIPGVINNEIKPINILKSTLSADHRLLDGAVAGKLLKDFNDIIEEPYDLWLMSDDMEII